MLRTKHRRQKHKRQKKKGCPTQIPLQSTTTHQACCRRKVGNLFVANLQLKAAVGGLPSCTSTATCSAGTKVARSTWACRGNIKSEAGKAGEAGIRPRGRGEHFLNPFKTLADNAFDNSPTEENIGQLSFGQLNKLSLQRGPYEASHVL